MRMNPGNIKRVTPVSKFFMERSINLKTERKVKGHNKSCFKEDINIRGGVAEGKPPLQASKPRRNGVLVPPFF